jgi:hypothetical protein
MGAKQVRSRRQVAENEPAFGIGYGERGRRTESRDDSAGERLAFVVLDNTANLCLRRGGDV